MEIARMGGPGECSDGLLDPDDEHPGFIPSDIRGRGGNMENKHVVERSRDKKDRQTSLSLVDKQLHRLPSPLLSVPELRFHLARGLM